MPGEIDLTLMHRFRERAERALPGRTKRFVLFGSSARAQARRGPDWDVAVFVSGRASSRDTLELANAAYDLIVETGESIHPALSEGGEGVSPLLLDRIAAEGIAL